jgi:hypothetical protein
MRWERYCLRVAPGLAFERARGEKRRGSQAKRSQHPIGDLFGFSYNPGDRTTRRREIEIPDKNDGALAVYRATRPNEPLPARDEKQGANLCAIEIILQRIWNGWKASV